MCQALLRLAMKPVDLSRGGESWSGWTFGPWGRAKEWRLHAPDGASYDVCEIAELRARALDLDYLQVRVRQLEQRERELLAKLERRFSASEIATLRAAAAILRQAEAPETAEHQNERRQRVLCAVSFPTTKEKPYELPRSRRKAHGRSE